MPAGRPKKHIDWDEFEKLCALQCTLIEIAGWFDMCQETVEYKVKEQYGRNFSDVFKEKRGKGKISLRRLQWQHAEKSPAMAIFLGKNYLGQTDKQTNESDSEIDYTEIAKLIDKNIVIQKK